MLRLARAWGRVIHTGMISILARLLRVFTIPATCFPLEEIEAQRSQGTCLEAMSLALIQLHSDGGNFRELLTVYFSHILLQT